MIGNPKAVFALGKFSEIEKNAYQYSITWLFVHIT